jgi:hypothetical protein
VKKPKTKRIAITIYVDVPEAMTIGETENFVEGFFPRHLRAMGGEQRLIGPLSDDDPAKAVPPRTGEATEPKGDGVVSYDIDIRSKHFCAHCGRDSRRESDSYQGELPEPTYNLTPIFDLALTGEPLPNPGTTEASVVLLRVKTDRPRGLRVLSGRKVGDSVAALEAALKRIQDDPEPFRKLEPDNGWGTLEDAIYVLTRMRDAARECNPDATWDIR